MYTAQELNEAKRAISSTLSKSEKAITKLKAGTFQHTMTAQGIKAYGIALAMIDRALGEADPPRIYGADELKDARSAIISARARVGKILPKFSAGTPQHTLGIRRIAAFEIASVLIEEELRAR